MRVSAADGRDDRNGWDGRRRTGSHGRQNGRPTKNESREPTRAARGRLSGRRFVPAPGYRAGAGIVGTPARGVSIIGGNGVRSLNAVPGRLNENHRQQTGAGRKMYRETRPFFLVLARVGARIIGRAPVAVISGLQKKGLRLGSAQPVNHSARREMRRRARNHKRLGHRCVGNAILERGRKRTRMRRDAAPHAKAREKGEQQERRSKSESE